MLDRDLAELYGVETWTLNQAVRRIVGTISIDFMFELTRDEIIGISQFVTSSSEVLKAYNGFHGVRSSNAV